jgi:tetratricopeptide (TPR) repeat protein
MFFAVWCSVCFAQKNITDSLQNVLEAYEHKDTVKVNLLNNIASKIFATDADKALILLAQSATLSDDLDYKKGKANSLVLKANVNFDKGNYLQTIKYYDQALGIFKELKDKKGMSVCYHNFGMAHYYLGDFDKAAINYKSAILYAEEANAQRRLSISLVGLGTLYSKQGEYDKGVESFAKAIQIDEKIGNKKGISNGLVNLGTLYNRQAKYTYALENFHKSLDIKEQIGDIRGTAAVLSNLGGVYERLDRDGDALSYYNKAYAIQERLKDKDGTVNTLINIALIEMKRNRFSNARNSLKTALSLSEDLGNKSKVADCLANMATVEMRGKNHDLALRYLKRAVAINEAIGSQRELSYCLMKMGQVYYDSNDLDTALQYADESAAIADKLKITDFQKDLALLHSEIYYSQQKFKLAYEKSLLNQKLNDSIFSVKNIDKAAQIKHKYAYRKKESSLKNDIKKKDGQLEESQQEKFWWITGSVCMLGAFCLAMALVKTKKVKMENKQLLTEQKLRRSQMNPHFIFNSIQNIRSLIYDKKENEAVDYLNKFSSLTRQILESSDESYTSLADEVKLIHNYVTIQQLLYGKTFDFDIIVDEALDADSVFLPPMLTQPFIENAIKHGLGPKEEKGRLEIRFLLHLDKLLFEVLDNGNGFIRAIPAANQKSMAIAITRQRLAHYAKDSSFEIHAANLTDSLKNIVGAKVSFEIPYIYEH